jgi:hypothetical protein
MGYDYNDCVCCYLQGKENYKGTISTICASCIESWKNVHINPGRVPSECMSHQGYGGTCVTCHQSRMFTFNVGLCDLCLTVHKQPERRFIKVENYDDDNSIWSKKDVEQCVTKHGYACYDIERNGKIQTVCYSLDPDKIQVGCYTTDSFEDAVDYIWDFLK